MFGWGKRKHETESSQPSRGEPIIAALLLEDGRFSRTTVQEAIAADPELGSLATDFEKSERVLGFQLGDEIGAVAPMPAPYPWSDLEGPCETSWMWPKETPAITLKRHRFHVLVTLIGGAATPIRRRLTLTRLTALAATQPSVIGIYWPDATLVHYPPVFIEMANTINEESAPPLYLWVDFRVLRNPDGTSAMFTTGMRALGHMEFEIPRIDMPPGELREWCVNIAYYMLDPATKIKDGDTIGMSAEQQIRIRHRASAFGIEGTVMQLQT